MPDIHDLPGEIVRLIFEKMSPLGPKKKKPSGFISAKKAKRRALENSPVGLLGSHELLGYSKAKAFFNAMLVCRQWRATGYDVIFKENSSDWNRKLRNKRQGHFCAWQIAIIRPGREWAVWRRQEQERAQWVLDLKRHDDGKCLCTLEGRPCTISIERSISILEYRFRGILQMAHDVSSAVSDFDWRLQLKIEASP